MSEEKVSNTIGGSFTGNYIGGSAEGNTMTNQQNQAPAPPDPDQIKFKDSLTQLHKAVEADPKLSQEQKQEVLEQLEILEEAVKNPTDKEKKRQADKVADALKWTIKMLSPAATFVEACNNLFPLITKVFGL